jgi:glycosyltransferase involved in cell wall biosynthesis
MKILLVNQCFYPDVVSTAQHTSDLAAALAARGHEVTVIAGNRGYDDPAVKFSSRERWRGVEIVRVRCLATGKGSRRKRALNIASFFLTCAWRMMRMRRFDLVIALTSPPLISVLGALFVRMTGGRFIFWIMDLNPDEAIAAGWLSPDSRTAHILEAALRYSAQSADRVIVLDRFMRDRMVGKGLAPDKVVTLPPWSHDNEIHYDAPGRAAFRARHGLDGKYVVMYSGNHSPCHPLDTVLGAALELASEPHIAFCFVGGGSEYRKMREFAARHNLRNIVCLPYRPLRELSASLSAADTHLVVMGRLMTGLVHPCKIYNVLTLGIPVLFVGPASSHVADIASGHPTLPIARVEHGDVAGLADRIRTGAARFALRRDRLSEDMRQAAGAFSMERLLPLYTSVIETIDLPSVEVEWNPVELQSGAPR